MSGRQIMTADEIRRDLLPLFEQLAKFEPDLRSTALGMWARGTDPSVASDAAAVREAAFAFLADPHQRDRGWGPVLLAILADPVACARCRPSHMAAAAARSTS